MGMSRTDGEPMSSFAVVTTVLWRTLRIPLSLMLSLFRNYVEDLSRGPSGMILIIHVLFLQPFLHVVQ